jgi:prephenate dehydratase
MKTIVYQGVKGAFSFLVAEQLYGEANEFIGKRHFKEVFEDVSKGTADLGVIPIENTLAGSIYENYDLLERYNLHVIAEHKLRIEHNLLATDGATIESLKKVFSHAKALEQCERFFEEHPGIEEVIADDTAGAAKYVSEQKNREYGAIASRQASELYGLNILKENIEDNPHNWTRFFVVSRMAEAVPTADKASLVFATSHTPGSLFRALKIIADNNLNMTKLQSRPIEGKPFEYYFYVDVTIPKELHRSFGAILEDLTKETQNLRLLGTYIAHEMID